MKQRALLTGAVAATVICGALGYWIGRAEALEARARAETIERDNQRLREQLGKMDTPERFDIESNERAALAGIRAIVTGVMVYSAESQDGGFPRSLEELARPEQPILDERLGAGRAHGYQFSYEPELPGDGKPVTSFTLSVRPEEYGKTGRRSFFVDGRGRVRFTGEDRAATRTDAPL